MLVQRFICFLRAYGFSEFRYSLTLYTAGVSVSNIFIRSFAVVPKELFTILFQYLHIIVQTLSFVTLGLVLTTKADATREKTWKMNTLTISQRKPFAHFTYLDTLLTLSLELNCLEYKQHVAMLQVCVCVVVFF